MRLLALFLTVLATAFSADAAGVVYRFESSTSGVTRSNFSGTVKADGPNIRIEVENGEGTMFKDGAVVVSRDGGRVLAVADLAGGTWYELRLEEMLAGGLLKDIAAMVDIRIANPKVTSRDLGPAGKLEGFDTRRTLLDTSHDLSVNALGQKLELRVSTRTETWTTSQLPGDFASFMQMRGARTGIAAIDTILAAQNQRGSGFPLKQVTIVKISQRGTESSSTTTLLVREPVKRVLGPAEFTLPPNLKKVEGPGS